jgi:hypothetical protein
MPKTVHDHAGIVITSDWNSRSLETVKTIGRRLISVVEGADRQRVPDREIQRLDETSRFVIVSRSRRCI